MFNNGSASDAVVTSGQRLWRQDVGYEYDVTNLTSNLPKNQMVASDSFTFGVLDSASNYSLAATVNVTIMNGIWAINSTSIWQCYEDEYNEIRLNGFAYNDREGAMSFKMIVVPSHGDLFEADKTTLVRVGSTISTSSPYPYNNGAKVFYRPIDELFTSPSVDWNGTELPLMPAKAFLTYYAYIGVGPANVSSTRVNQELVVTNVNDNSSLTCPDTVFEVRATSVLGDDSEANQVIISNFSVTEKDRAVDPVRVSIKVNTGYVSLNKSALDRLSFESGCGSTWLWRCRGDGITERTTIFIGAPKDVQNALNGISYQTYYQGVSDTMTITLYDGSEGSCIHEFPTTSRRDTCVSTSCTISLNVSDKAFDWGEPESWVTLHWTVVLVLFCLFAALAGCIAVKVVTFAMRIVIFIFCCCGLPRMLRRRKGSPVRDQAQPTGPRSGKAKSAQMGLRGFAGKLFCFVCCCGPCRLVVNIVRFICCCRPHRNREQHRPEPAPWSKNQHAVVVVDHGAVSSKRLPAKRRQPTVLRSVSGVGAWRYLVDFSRRRRGASANDAKHELVAVKSSWGGD